MLLSANIFILINDYDCVEQKMSESSVWQEVCFCAVCGKVLESSSRPQLLPCCHSACKDCIDDQIAEQQELNATQHNDHNNGIYSFLTFGFAANQCVVASRVVVMFLEAMFFCTEPLIIQHVLHEAFIQSFNPSTQTHF